MSLFHRSKSKSRSKGKGTSNQPAEADEADGLTTPRTTESLSIRDGVLDDNGGGDEGQEKDKDSH